jgi:uncharacterized protein (TIGR02117 family)
VRLDRLANGSLEPENQKSLLRHHLHKIGGSLFFLFLISCSSTTELQSLAHGQASKTVYVIHDYWHSAIVIRTSDIPREVLPEVRDFPDAEYMEFSWGDRDYFPHPDPGIRLALKAAFWSSGSILHVVGFRGAVEEFYPQAHIIEIPVPHAEWPRLIQFVSDTFTRNDPTTRAEPRPGLYNTGRFYLANGRFSLFRTCNTWIAEALSSAGLPINPSTVITAGTLGRRVEALGTLKHAPAAASN